MRIELGFLRFCFLLSFQFFNNNSTAQNTISGNFPALKGEKVYFGVFQGLRSKILDSAQVSYDGRFSFSYDSHLSCIGYVTTSEKKPFLLILDKNENIQISGINFGIPESIHVLEGKQNIAFAKYATEHPQREQALSAWEYLENIYTQDSMFSVQVIPAKAIVVEKNRINHEDQQFLNNLDHDWYLAWYLPIRKFVSDVQNIAQYNPEEIPITISLFRSINYSDVKLYNSGLLKNAIENHFWLLENSGKPLNTIFIEMKISIDSMFVLLIQNQERLNEVTNFLFDLLERHSLFQTSEYLALKALNESNCTLNLELTKQLETYRVMKKGNIAKDILFDKNLKSTLTPIPKKLSEMKNPFTLIVFGASWCQSCIEELPKIINLYYKWKSKGLEVIFISLDETKEIFDQFVAPFPFQSYCDFEKWNSPVVNNYYVFSTPTMFLLDQKRTIVLRPISIQQMDAWVDWNLN